MAFSDQRRPGGLDWLALMVLVAVWGSSFATIKVALESFGPNWLAAGRLSIAALVVAIFVAPRLKPLRPIDYLVLVVFGFFGTTLPFVFIGWASLVVPSAVVGLVMASSPILVMVFSLVLLPEERLTPARLGGLALGFVGVALVIIGRQGAVVTGAADAFADLMPYLALIAGASCYALNTIIARRLVHIPVVSRSLGVLAGAGITAIVFAGLTEPLPQSVSLESLLALAYLALLPTAVGGMLIYWLIERTSPRFVVQTNFLVPVVAVAIGATLLSETLTAQQYIGVAVIVAGLMLAEQVWRRS
jgi:drug/metabolite transporter (DMT)-like permease